MIAWVLMLGTAWIILLLIPLAFAGPAWVRGLKSRTWEPTSGSVQSSVIVPGGGKSGGSQPLVTYEYTVAGKTYQGKNVSFHFNWTTPPGVVIQRYPPHSAITVYYNPLKPEQSVLEPGIKREDVKRFLMPFVLGPILLLGAWIFVGLFPATFR
jgi:hypothetical protein